MDAHALRGVTARLSAVAAAVALLAAGTAGAGSNTESAARTTVGPAVSGKEVALRQDMRKLWEDHVTWTRVVIISFAAGLPDLKAAQARLLRNQTDIGRAIRPFYGAGAGNKLSSLLRDHILIAVDVLTAAKANDKPGLADAQARWTANADQIAALLNSANPRFWKLGEMRSMLRTHLKLTTNEAVARLTGKWATDVRVFDAVHRQALAMADMLSEGIIRQFPNRF